MRTVPPPGLVATGTRPAGAAHHHAVAPALLPGHHLHLGRDDTQTPANLSRGEVTGGQSTGLYTSAGDGVVWLYLAAVERPGADEVEGTRGRRGLAGIIATPATVNGGDKTYHWGGGMMAQRFADIYSLPSTTSPFFLSPEPFRSQSHLFPDKVLV